MTVNKGLLSLVENTPNFSDQALENAINEIKAIDKDDGHQFILSQFLLDTAIHDNTVLTTSQKNDVLDAIYNAQPHLQIGRYLNDVVRHTKSIIDGSIIPVDELTNPIQRTFLEIMQDVLSLQSLVPELYGVAASEKKRSVNDHLGTLNNIFVSTTDSTAPVFTRLKEIMELIDATSRANTVSGLNLAITNAAAGNLNLRTFLAGLVADSTDFQQSLDNMVNLCTNKYATLNTRISEIPGDPTTDLVAIREEINTQVALENSNLLGMDTYVETLTNQIAYTSLASDADLRSVLVNTAQDLNWQSYFRDYETNQSNLNPLYTTDTDSDKSGVIDQVLADSGLPDVTDATDLEAVAEKAKRDSRIDTANFDRYTVETQITKSCEQLGITTANRTISALSNSLLNNMNKFDRDEIARSLDLNEDAETLS
jgi:hypothetical protein